MIRITKLTDYALLIITHLAKTPGETMSATSLAEVLHLSIPTVSKILKMLAEAELVNSIRGVDGGYHLARDAKDINVADVIVAMEGEFAMTECCENISMCTIDSMCTMRENWRKINKMVKNLLSSFTINDMMAPIPSQLASLEWQDDK